MNVMLPNEPVQQEVLHENCKVFFSIFETNLEVTQFPCLIN